MKIDLLIKMANEIALFFEADPDPRQADEGIYGHLRRFWDPRMRRSILDHVDRNGGEGLRDSVIRAIGARRKDFVG